MIAGMMCFVGFTEVSAEPLICPFTDYFYVEANTPAQIVSLSQDGNVMAKKIDSAKI